MTIEEAVAEALRIRDLPWADRREPHDALQETCPHEWVLTAAPRGLLYHTCTVCDTASFDSM